MNDLFSMNSHRPLYFVLGTLSLCTFLLSCNHFNPDNGPIRLNQVGFAPDQEKTATIVISNLQSPISNPQIIKSSNCYILNIAGDTVWRGEASETMLNPISGKPCQIIDFSDLTAPGEYTLYVENSEISNLKFQISNRPYRELTRSSLRAYYHQRASMATEEPYAEGFARPAGHPDDHVIVHASAATEERPAGTIISSPGGWYDAGDYNKYIVNSGFTMGVWLMAYEFNKPYYDTLCLNIPESQMTKCENDQMRKCPDMLSEALYNLRWMMTMQDLDGGVYHKLTEPAFERFIRPDQCKKPRYVVMKTTASSLDFAATMALAARVYAPYDADFAAQAKETAEKAYAWAVKHPEVYYDQPKMNAQFASTSCPYGAKNEERKQCAEVQITTGAYDDFDVTDEFLWAATELYLLTGDEKYKHQTSDIKHQTSPYVPASWGKVTELAYLECLMHPELETDVTPDALVDYLAPYIRESNTISVFRSPYGNRESDFFWGCNSEGCCWRGVECLYAYRLTGDNQYRINAERCLNYVLGQNATGFCYVTGFGAHPTKDPHHRLSYSHPKGTLPGFLAGGPNPARQDAKTDGVKYPKNVPADESYLDYQPSYASNEVTINWNVTLFALSAALDALDQK